MRWPHATETDLEGADYWRMCLGLRQAVSGSLDGLLGSTTWPLPQPA